MFDGTPLIGDRDGWRELEPRGTRGFGRGVGVADLADAIQDDRPPGASAQLALHVLDALNALEDGGRSLDLDLAQMTTP